MGLDAGVPPVGADEGDPRGSRREVSSDLLSNANTVLYMGKIREGTRFRRAIYVAKHRGSACTDEIIPFHIDNGGIELDM